MAVKFGFMRSAIKSQVTVLRYGYCHSHQFCFALTLPLTILFLLLKEMGGTDYYCPACRAKFNFELSDSEKGQPKIK